VRREQELPAEDAFLRLVSEIYALSPELLDNVPREVLKEAESAKEMTFKCIKGP